MKKICKILAMATLATLATSVNADCLFGDKVVKIGDSISMQDPVLVAESAAYYVSKGYSEEEAKELALTSNWTTLVLECVRTFTPASTPNQDKVFGMVERSTAALVPTAHQISWVEEQLQ